MERRSQRRPKITRLATTLGAKATVGSQVVPAQIDDPASVTCRYASMGHVAFAHDGLPETINPSPLADSSRNL